MSEAPQAPTSRYESIEFRMPDVEKFVAGLEAGVFEAYKTLSWRWRASSTSPISPTSSWPWSSG